MLTAWWRHLPHPHSLRQQLMLALLMVAALIVAGGLTAVYTLHTFADTTQHLAKERLARMQIAQDLYSRALLIEHETHQMLTADSIEGTRGKYAEIIEHLGELDALVHSLGAAGNDVSILTLYQSGQQYRNLIHVVAPLQGNELRANADFAKSLRVYTQNLLATSEPAAVKLTALLYRLRDENRKDQIEILRNEFAAQVKGASHLLPILLDNQPGSRGDGVTPSAQISFYPFVQRLKLVQQQQTLRSFRKMLQRQTVGLLEAAEKLSTLFTRDYREAIQQLAVTSENKQRHILILLGGSLVLAFLFFRYFVCKRVLSRLQTVSRYIRSDDTSGEHPQVPVQGNDEIGEMARRVEKFLEDRQQLAERTAELSVARDTAEAANKAKSAFLANMSHELRTPMNAILGFSNLMRREPDLTESQREKLDIVNRSGEHLLALINDVLEVAKIEAGRMSLATAPLDLGGMVRDVVDMMRLRAEERGLSLQFDQSSEFPRFIKGDEGRLRQILVNLVGNAVKFTEQGSVTIRLRAEDDDAQSPAVQLDTTSTKRLFVEVEDTGTGIAPENMERLFQPFVQLAESTMQKGTGLGLTITRQYVQLMNGTIGVESELGKGTVFRIELPVELASGNEVTTRLSDTHMEEVCGLEPGQPEFRILIAEDNKLNQIIIMKLMTSIGLNAKIAGNGKECVNIFQEWHPHLIWMDRRMPVMDGIEATKNIRALPGGDDVKIIALTASVFSEEVQILLDAGVDEYLRKPYKFYEIYDCMARNLGMKYIYTSDQPEKNALAMPA